MWHDIFARSNFCKSCEFANDPWKLGTAKVNSDLQKVCCADESQARCDFRKPSGHCLRGHKTLFVVLKWYQILPLLFLQLKELQTRQAALLTLQRDAEIRLAEAEEEVIWITSANRASNPWRTKGHGFDSHLGVLIFSLQSF